MAWFLGVVLSRDEWFSCRQFDRLGFARRGLGLDCRICRVTSGLAVANLTDLVLVVVAFLLAVGIKRSLVDSCLMAWLLAVKQLEILPLSHFHSPGRAGLDRLTEAR